MYIAIDIGGTNIRIASFSSLTQDHPENIEKMSMQNNYAEDLKNIIATISTHEHVEGIGVSIRGVLDAQKSSIEISSFISDWVDRPFQQDLSEAFHCPVRIENDAASSALGEAVFGQGKDKDFIFIIWGTGIGATAVRHNHGEISLEPFETGHQIMDWDGENCLCGQKGCLELFSSGGHIVNTYHKTPDQLTEQQWDEVLAVMAQAMTNVVIIRPAMLMIFDGGVAINNPEKIKVLEKLIQEHLTVTPAPELVVSSLEGNSGLYGAFALLKTHLAQ